MTSPDERSPEQQADDEFFRDLAGLAGIAPITEDDPHSEDGFGQGDDTPPARRPWWRWWRK